MFRPLLLLLCVGIGAALPTWWCFYNQTTVSISSIYRNDDPAWLKGVYTLSEHSYDWTNGRWHSKTFQLDSKAPSEKPTYVHQHTVLSLRDIRSTFVIMPNGTCRRVAYDGAYSGQCWYQFMWMYNTTLGGSGMPVSVFYDNETSGVVQKGYHEFHQVFATFDKTGRMIPVVMNQYATGPNGYFGTYQFENLRKGVNPSMFGVPKACKGLKEEKVRRADLVDVTGAFA